MSLEHWGNAPTAYCLLSFRTWRLGVPAMNQFVGSVVLVFHLTIKSSSSPCWAYGLLPSSSSSGPLIPSVGTPTSTQLAMSSSSSSSPSTYTHMGVLSKAASKALGRQVNLQSTSGAGASGGGGASTQAVHDTVTNTKYFVKAARNNLDMLRAEYLGVKAMAESKTIKVPTPVVFGEYPQGNRAFVIFEWLEFTSGGSQYELGQQLAKMHRSTSPNGKFGFDVDNTIGATPQLNLPWMDNWADFWCELRLGHMLKLTNNARLSQAQADKLRAKTRELLSHNPEPSLIHGDLWGGNKGFCKDLETGKVVPCIFDPATYYGDREADVAMTYVFGGFSSEFYKGYNDEWPLPKGHEKRRTVYNLYHILNHQVLFGGMYMNQARGMIDEILRM